MTFSKAENSYKISIYARLGGGDCHIVLSSPLEHTGVFLSPTELLKRTVELCLSPLCCMPFPSFLRCKETSGDQLTRDQMTPYKRGRLFRAGVEFLQRIHRKCVIHRGEEG